MHKGDSIRTDGLQIPGLVDDQIQAPPSDMSNTEPLEDVECCGSTLYESCPICFDVMFDNAAVFSGPCGHPIHRACLEQWHMFCEAPRCPICREDLGMRLVDSTLVRDEVGEDEERPDSWDTPVRSLRASPGSHIAPALMGVATLMLLYSIAQCSAYRFPITACLFIGMTSFASLMAAVITASSPVHDGRRSPKGLLQLYILTFNATIALCLLVIADGCVYRTVMSMNPFAQYLFSLTAMFPCVQWGWLTYQAVTS